jgi:hypothetical protein
MTPIGVSLINTIFNKLFSCDITVNFTWFLARLLSIYVQYVLYQQLNLEYSIMFLALCTV